MKWQEFYSGIARKEGGEIRIGVAQVNEVLTLANKYTFGMLKFVVWFIPRGVFEDREQRDMWR